ncbi:MAG: DinB family protein [Longimicrobiales bacterium]
MADWDVFEVATPSGARETYGVPTRQARRGTDSRWAQLASDRLWRAGAAVAKMRVMEEVIRELFAHLRWADELVLGSLRGGAGASPRALELYAHVLGAEAVWLARLRGVATEVPVWPAADVETCAELIAKTHAGLAAHIDSLDSSAFKRRVHYRNSAGVEFDSRIGDILLHVMLHGAYHRGQVALLLRGAGATPAPTDYIAFVRGAPAARRDGELPDPR